MRVATFHKYYVHQPRLTPGDVSDQRIYHVSPPLEDRDGVLRDYVMVSGVHNDAIHETYIFPSDGDKVINMLDMIGSFQGRVSHNRALFDAGCDAVWGAN